MICIGATTLVVTNVAFSATHYIDYVRGSDSNDGTTKSTPWKHCPGMVGFVGTYTHAAGDQFIFKGGVTWPASVLSLKISTGGESGNPDYYGVDQTWHTGSSWTRPIFNGSNSVIGSGADKNLIDLSYSNHVTIDNLEVTGLLISGNTFGVASIGGWMPTASGILIENCYIHNWQAGAAVTSDDYRGGIIFTSPAVASIVVDHCTISNLEQAEKMNGIAIYQVSTVSNCNIHDVSDCIQYVGNIFNNIIYNINTPNATFDNTFHTNLAYIALWQGSGAATTVPANIYNNIIHDSNAGAQVYPVPCTSGNNGTVNIYNNVMWNIGLGGGGDVLVDTDGGTGACGTVNVYNNTFEVSTSSGSGIRAINNRGGTNNVNSMTIQNNQYITEHAPMNLIGVTTLVQDNNLTQSHATATSQGYVSGNNYAPIAYNNSTVKTGTNNPSSLFTTDILGISRGSVWDIGAYQYQPKLILRIVQIE
jgi:hypothetical protein